MVWFRKDRISEWKVQFDDIFPILECNVKCDCGCVCTYIGSWKITLRGTIDRSVRLGTNRMASSSTPTAALRYSFMKNGDVTTFNPLHFFTFFAWLVARRGCFLPHRLFIWLRYRKRSAIFRRVKGDDNKLRISAVPVISLWVFTENW